MEIVLHGGQIGDGVVSRHQAAGQHPADEIAGERGVSAVQGCPVGANRGGSPAHQPLFQRRGRAVPHVSVQGVRIRPLLIKIVVPHAGGSRMVRQSLRLPDDPPGVLGVVVGILPEIEVHRQGERGGGEDDIPISLNLIRPAVIHGDPSEFMILQLRSVDPEGLSVLAPVPGPQGQIGDKVVGEAEVEDVVVLPCPVDLMDGRHGGGGEGIGVDRPDVFRRQRRP